MSTNSNIGIALPGDDFLVTYVHSDGYPSGVAKDVFTAIATYPGGPKKGLAAFAKLIKGKVGQFGISMIGHSDFLANLVLIDWERDINIEASADDWQGRYGGTLRIYDRPIDRRDSFDWRAKGSDLKAKGWEEYFTYIATPAGLLMIIGNEPQPIIPWTDTPDWDALNTAILNKGRETSDA